MNYNWDWGLLFVEPYLGFLVSGLRTTVLIALAAWVIAFSLGSLLGIARTAPLCAVALWRCHLCRAVSRRAAACADVPVVFRRARDRPA
jgi:ABC-type amino acid transport system permease subunit